MCLCEITKKKYLFLLKKKVLLQAGNDGQISVIDVVPIESTDSNDATPITVSLAPDPTSESSQQVTAQVAVVQADSPTDTGPHYITVTGKSCLVLPFFIISIISFLHALLKFIQKKFIL